MKPRAYVFDLDGTLVDSKIDFAAMRAELNIANGEDVLAKVAALAVTDRQMAMEIIFKHEHLAVTGSKVIPGAREFIELVRKSGFPCAVFTRNAHSLARECLRMHDIQIDLLIAREDGPAKPKPDGLFSIAKQFGVKTDEMLFLGDYIYDLQAGLAAGVPTALYLPEPADFSTTGAAFEFESFESLQAMVLDEKR